MSGCFRKGLFGFLAAITFVSFQAFAQEDPAAPSASPPAPAPAPAQEMPASRPKYDIELNKESSSFVTDPDSLDPLPLKKESLKEDEEPMLDDIKSILNKKSSKAAKKPKAKKSSNSDASEPAKPKAQSQVKPKKRTVVKKTSRKSQKITPQVLDVSNLSSDDPDFSLEKKFNDIYKKYNVNPTADDVWGAASNQAANVYVVQKGDTLFTISRTLFGDPQFWPKIWALNNEGITNPHLIAPGTQIFFYPGEAGTAPSLSIGQGERDNSMRQNTEFNKLVQEGARGKIPMQDIPPSFPAYKGGVTSRTARETKILISPKTEIADRAPENPYILTSTQIETDYKVGQKDTNALVCKDNQYVPEVLKIGKDAAPGRYNMLVQDTFNFGRLKRTYIYRIIGEAEVASDSSLRISQCITPVNTDVLLVKSDELEIVKPPTELIPNTRSQIIEGVEVNAQQYFYAHQYVILNMSQLPALEGADLKVYSTSAGGVVGAVRILKRTGTMAIGYVIENDGVVQLGDRVILPE